ncbi:MAG: hypothetical protein M5R36_19820 [Deltaproteobacteria bacterium]|nr:hypothetical protein [Deltaproteobacteria bacterium]
MAQVLLTLIIVFSALMILLTLAVMITGLLRRRDALPPDMLDGDLPGDASFRGHYLGTVVTTTGKSFRASEFLAPGKGAFYVDAKGVNFLVDHSRQPVHLPFHRVNRARAEPDGTGAARQLLAVDWTAGDKAYTSHFALDDADPAGFLPAIEKARIGASGKTL